MTQPILYAHPFSSYCWKVLIALWERAVAFDYRDIGDPAHAAEWQRLSPTGKMPLLVDEGRAIVEATIIVEHLDLHHGRPETRLIPADPAAALEVRMLDRLSDNYVMGGLQTIVFDALRPASVNKDPHGVARARQQLDAAYRWWNAHIAGREWAAGDSFTLADCATAPALFYADWAHPIPVELDALRGYRARLNARPSVARAIEEARPYRAGFPLGAPDRD